LLGLLRRTDARGCDYDIYTYLNNIAISRVTQFRSRTDYLIPIDNIVVLV